MHKESTSKNKLKNLIKIEKKIEKKAIKWLVDVDLGSGKKISRQHAAILYNFIDKM